ncbi:phosphotransferase [candidate division WOR-3 bacterium]|nr:phosphotransferase [candidate division WOR-3 bacterium]
MEKEVVELFTDDIKDEVASRFVTKKEELKLLGDAENFVYSYPYDGAERILRVTHSSHRTVNQIKGEIDWLNYLADRGVPAAREYDSPQGDLIEVIQARDGSFFMAVSFQMAPGRRPQPSECTPELICKWGRIVGLMHRLTKDYPDPGDDIRREHWHEFDYLNVEKYLQESDAVIVEKTGKLVEHIKKLPVGKDTYGLLHTDVHQHNIFADDAGNITVFDFDDIHHIWFAADIAIILFYSRWLCEPTGDMAEYAKFWLTNFWEGYRRENLLDDWWKSTYHDFLKLREIQTYVWLNKKWDMDNLDERQQAAIERFRHNIENDVPLVDVDFTSI